MIQKYLKFEKYLNLQEMEKMHQLMKNLSNYIFNTKYKEFKELYYIKTYNCENDFIDGYKKDKLKFLQEKIKRYQSTNDTHLLNEYILPNLLLSFKINDKENYEMLAPLVTNL